VSLPDTESGVLYCIVSIHLYVALPAVHTNQKRFQCERPKEKRAVLRERKEARGTSCTEPHRINIYIQWYTQEFSTGGAYLG